MAFHERKYASLGLRLAGLMLLPSLWVLLRKRGTDARR